MVVNNASFLHFSDPEVTALDFTFIAPSAVMLQKFCDVENVPAGSTPICQADKGTSPVGTLLHVKPTSSKSGVFAAFDFDGFVIDYKRRGFGSGGVGRRHLFKKGQVPRSRSASRRAARTAVYPARWRFAGGTVV